MSDQNKVVKISTASKKLDGNNNWNSSNFENDGREDSVLCKDEKYLNFQKLLDSIIDEQTNKTNCSKVYCKVGKLYYGENSNEQDLGFISFVSCDEERIVILIPFIENFSRKINTFKDAVYKQHDVSISPYSKDNKNLALMRNLVKNYPQIFPIFLGSPKEYKKPISYIINMNSLNYSQLYFAVSFLREFGDVVDMGNMKFKFEYTDNLTNYEETKLSTV